MFTKKKDNKYANTNSFSFSDKMGMKQQLHRGSDPSMMQGTNNNQPSSLFSGGGSKRLPQAIDWSQMELNEDDYDDLSFLDTSASKGGTSSMMGSVKGTPDKMDELNFDRIQLMDASATADATLKLSMLAPAPVYMEAGSTFVSDLPAALTLTAVEDVLEKNAVNGVLKYEVDIHGKQQIRGVILMPNRAEFVIQFYRSRQERSTEVFPSRRSEGGGQQVFVEFQRRGGCARTFRAFYHDTLDSFTGNWHHPFTPQPYSSFPSIAPAESGVGAFDLDIEVDFDFADTISTLVTMASCEMTDMRRKAVKALLMVAKNDISKTQLADLLNVEQEKSQLLTTLINSSDEDCVADTHSLMKNLNLSLS